MEGPAAAVRRWKRSNAGCEWEPGPQAESVEVHFAVTHASNAPGDDLSPAELTGACPAPTRCQALASPSPVSFSSVCPPHLVVLNLGSRSARRIRQRY